jgi:type I restriction enzyme S subunit
MQQLLTGKKRLPGFEGEWKEVKLGSLGKTYNGLTGKTKEDFGEGKPFITYMNIFSNPKINISNFEYVKMGVNENQNKAIYGDIFFTVSSETPNEVGMASVLLDEINDLYLNSFCFGFRLNDFKNLLPEFSSYLFRNDLFRKDVYKLAQGSTRFNLSKLELMKIKIKLPSLSEQTAIAEILATADRELQLQKDKLAQLQSQKKGLMQVLLTGKKRLIN